MKILTSALWNPPSPPEFGAPLQAAILKISLVLRDAALQAL
jgi:hypothetical protein